MSFSALKVATAGRLCVCVQWCRAEHIQFSSCSKQDKWLCFLYNISRAAEHTLEERAMIKAPAWPYTDRSCLIRVKLIDKRERPLPPGENKKRMHCTASGHGCVNCKRNVNNESVTFIDFCQNNPPWNLLMQSCGTWLLKINYTTLYKTEKKSVLCLTLYDIVIQSFFF